jgi:hypothetical protein
MNPDEPRPPGEEDQPAAGPRPAAPRAPQEPSLTELLRRALLADLPPPPPPPEPLPPPGALHPDHTSVLALEFPQSGYISPNNPVRYNTCPRPPLAEDSPQFFPVWNETSTNLPAAQRHEHEITYALTSYLQDHVQVLHECAEASGNKPLFTHLRDDAHGILMLAQKRLDALKVMAAKGVDAGAYVAAATINPLANMLNDPESRAALEKYEAQQLRRDLNKAVWGNPYGGRGYGGRGGGSGSSAAAGGAGRGTTQRTGAPPAASPAAPATQPAGTGRAAGRYAGRGGRGRGRLGGASSATA